MEEKQERQLCAICKKGYLLEHKTNTRSLLTSQHWDFLDCTNLTCKIHKDFTEKYNDFSESQKQEET